jgi:P27 family predicted phage terminase small subunit
MLKGPPLPPPKYLLPEAKALWKRLWGQLTVIGVLTQLDLETFEAFCQSYARYRQADAQLTREGFTKPVRDHSQKIIGYQKHPAWKVASEALREFDRLGASLGLNPAARSRISVGSVSDTQSEVARRLLG